MPLVIGDVWRIYAKKKPFQGMMVFRKKTTEHVSERVAASKKRVKEYSLTKGAPAKIAHDMCCRAGYCVKKKVYVRNKGYEVRDVCPADKMRTFLSRVMTEVHYGAGAAPAVAKAAELV
mgnify:CR=1 FL=1